MKKRIITLLLVIFSLSMYSCIHTNNTGVTELEDVIVMDCVEAKISGEYEIAIDEKLEQSYLKWSQNNIYNPSQLIFENVLALDQTGFYEFKISYRSPMGDKAQQIKILNENRKVSYDKVHSFKQTTTEKEGYYQWGTEEFKTLLEPGLYSLFIISE